MMFVFPAPFHEHLGLDSPTIREKKQRHEAGHSFYRHQISFSAWLNKGGIALVAPREDSLYTRQMHLWCKNRIIKSISGVFMED